MLKPGATPHHRSTGAYVVARIENLRDAAAKSVAMGAAAHRVRPPGQAADKPRSAIPTGRARARPSSGLCGVVSEPLGQRGTFAVYKMMVDVSGKERVFLFWAPGCRKRMLEWWDELLGRAEDGEDIREIRI